VPTPTPQDPAPASIAREDVLRQMRACDGNMSLTAARLGISRNTLYRHCKRLGIPLRRARQPLG
jgi:sigma-54 dependent transcriptional regulator, acetoin dehydrogenase operon transcriptional activator AcoR